jgi:serine/threonine protein phosphatase 1
MLYAIGDIHGRLDLLEKLYPAIKEDIEKVKDPKGAQIIFLGDYVDRGPDSKGVLDYLMNLKDDEHTKHIFLYGNHEDLMVNSYKGSDSHYATWVNNGGERTIKSIGCPQTPYGGYDTVGAITLEPYVKWAEKLPRFYTAYDYIFCHSGYLRTDYPISLESQENLLIWGRPHKGMYVGYNKWVIHGHTPRNGKPEIDVNRVNVDTGGWHNSLNTLAGVVLPHGECKESDLRFIQIYLPRQITSEFA